MAPATDQELDSNEHLSRHRKQSSSALASRDDQSPLRDTATFWDRQYHSNPRNIVEQPSSGSKRHALTQSPLPVAMSQWEQLLNLRLLHHHVQEGHLLSQPGVNAPGVPQPFIPIGTIDGSYGYVFSSQPSNMPGSATSLLQSFQRGIIRTPGKLSQKHQQLWDAQLQSEITDYKSRIMKLEAEIPPVKQAVEDPIAHVAGSAVSRKSSKRGRPMKLAAPVDAPPSLDKPDQIQAQARKSEPCKGQPEARAHIFEEVVLYKVENKEEQSNAIVSTADQENKKNSKMLPNNMISNDYMAGDPSIDNKGALATYLGEMNKRNLAWPCIISAKDSAKDVLKISSEAFYNNGSVIQQVGNFIPRWSLMMNGEDASNEFADGLVALSKDENEEEMNWRWVFLLGNFTFPLDNKSSVLLFGSAVDEVDDEKSAQLGPNVLCKKLISSAK
ncbi:Cys-Gly metallodipeptidase DUG [Salix suchowensis]|nr:Cys-Gly metallodipeptidase DUG [Salix suchowensis]